jgi:hypothetical protein
MRERTLLIVLALGLGIYTVLIWLSSLIICR